MRVELLQCRDFRNYERLSLECGEGVHLVWGPNGSGKTNLLEAIYYFAAGRSPRTARDAELVREGAAGFALRLQLQRSGTSQTLEVGYDAERGKWIRIDGVSRSRPASLYGRLRAVFFSPDDLWLIKGGPARRRALLDRALLQLSPVYEAALARYENALAQRNALLREVRAGRAGRALLEIWDDELVQYGVDVALRRFAAARSLSAAAARAYGHLAGGEPFACQYRSGIPGADEALQAGEAPALAEAFRAALGEMQRAELERGFTLVGPHRDDLDVEVGGRPARTFGSQGQQRSAVLALKLAERDLLAVDGELPILLLDDVLSELDAGRRAALRSIVAGGGQAFVTATDPEALLAMNCPSGRAFHVWAGRVEAWQPAG